MDPRYGTPRSVDAVDPTASYDTWPTLPSTRENDSRCCHWCRWRLSWSAMSVVEIALMLLAVVFYFFFTETSLKHMLRKDDGEGKELVTPLSEWMLRMVGSMICVQVSMKIYYLTKMCSKKTILCLKKQRTGAMWLISCQLINIFKLSILKSSKQKIRKERLWDLEIREWKTWEWKRRDKIFQFNFVHYGSIIVSEGLIYCKVLVFGDKSLC